MPLPRLWPAGAALALLALLLSVTVLPTPATAQDAGQQPLVAGWNNVRYDGQTLPVEQALNDAGGLVTRIFAWEPATQGWSRWAPNLPASLITLQELETGRSYFVFASGQATWAQPGSAGATAQTSVGLQAGWSNVTYQGPALPVAQALGDAGAAVTGVWRFDPGTQGWLRWGNGLPGALISLPQLEPGGVYFVSADLAQTWVQDGSGATEGPNDGPGADPGDADGEGGTGGDSGSGSGGGAGGGAGASAAVTPWTITFERDTALFAFEDSLNLESEGIGTATTSGASSAVTATNAELTTINDLLAAESSFADWPADTRSGCSSCFRYTITIVGPGGTHTLQTDGVGATGSLFDLVNVLTGILLGA